MNSYAKYEAVIGLEIHTQLSTKSKAYSSDSTEYGVLPNTNISAISLGHPGTLPKSNKKVIEYAVRLGLACKSDIREVNEYARKNYFYADLPKGYQITQDKTPICTGGFLMIKLNDGSEKKINITRIHMEEGSMRCDATVSVRLKGAKEFGKRTETKNMNSIRNVQRAIEYEIKRQIDIIENGGEISQDTMGFDAVAGTTYLMRSKEMANDYRYFPEPDLQPVIVTKEYIEKVKQSLPPLPNELFKKYTSLGLSEYDAGVLTDSKEIALYFEKIIAKTKNAKSASNWLTVQIKSFLNDSALHISDFKISPERIADLVNFIDSGKVSHTIATQKIFPMMLEDLSKSPAEIAAENNWIQESDSGALTEFVKEAIAKYPEKVIEYKNGKTNLLGLFMGEVMKLSKGKADPKVATELVKEMLEK